MIDRHTAILQALAAKPNTTNQLASVCACTPAQASLRTAELAKAGKIWRSGNGRWVLSAEERVLRPTVHSTTREEGLDAVVSLLVGCQKSATVLAQESGLSLQDVSHRLSSAKSQGLVCKAPSGKAWALAKHNATRDPSPFPPPWWETPNIGLWG